MSSHPCRIRNRKQLLSSLYHNTPLVCGVITALDDGLNRHNPCPCLSCQTQTKRSSSNHPDSPPSKRARTRSPPSPTSPPTSPTSVTYSCHWCSFPDHSPRLSCRQCGRRTAPPPMAQHFRLVRAPINRPVPYLEPPATAILHQQHSLSTPSLHTDHSPSYDFSYLPNYPSKPIPPQLPPILPEPFYFTPAQSAHLQYHSPQSTILDPTEITQYHSISALPSPSMASKSINSLDKHQYATQNPHSTHNHDISVVSLMEQVSKQVSDHPDNLPPAESPGFSLASEFSDVTAVSVVELGAVQNHSKLIENNKSLSHHDDGHADADADADIFLTDIIMSEKETHNDTCSAISDLPLTLLEGMFPSINE